MDRATVADLPFDLVLTSRSWDDYLALEAVGDELNSYLAAFVHSEKCIKCEADIAKPGIVGALLNSFTWGLVNGEGHCGRCGWPARAYHRNVGRIEFWQQILQYHPDYVEEKQREHPDVE